MSKYICIKIYLKPGYWYISIILAPVPYHERTQEQQAHETQDTVFI